MRTEEHRKTHIWGVKITCDSVVDDGKVVVIETSQKPIMRWITNSYEREWFL